ncbi:MAG: ROK family protein, partial [Micromonosporaceae bacterium]|nr:ROK family protein [Micromonosporaceae bacterium]
GLAAGAASPPTACGVGTAGAVDTHGRVTHATSTLPGWAGTDVRSRLSRRLSLPVTVHNDVHVMALGEARFGAAAGVADALVVAVGTGVGGAIVARGELVAGRHGFGGSIGHLPAVRRDGRLCGCGLRDHVEAYAAGPAIVAAYATRCAAQSPTLEEIGDMAAAGDPLAAQVIAEAAEVLGTGLAAAVNLIDPAVVVLGGGVIGLGPALLDPAEAAMRAAALPGPDRVPLRPAALGPAAVVAGAAAAALDISGGR